MIVLRNKRRARSLVRKIKMRDSPSVASCDVYEVRHALSLYSADGERMMNEGDIMNEADGYFSGFPGAQAGTAGWPH